MKKKDKIRKGKSIQLAAVLILLSLIILFSVRAYRHYSILKSHREYFSQKNPQIQPWMTLNSVIRHFNITQDEIKQELKISDSIPNRRITIASICRKNHLNCTESIGRLNAREQ